jgi:cysteine desulfurase/selenocysteine lyase
MIDGEQERLAMEFDYQKVRADFPHLDQRLYLNTASAGLAWKGAGKAAARFFETMYNRGYDGREDWRAVAGRVQTRIGRLAGVSPRDVGFASSTTEALNLIAHSLPVQQGDRVVICEDEFPSVRAVAEIMARRGAKLVAVPVCDEAARTQALAAAARDSRFVLASHVHWESGARIDLEPLSAACGQNGAFLIVDGIQALGAAAVTAGLVDAYLASTFKWLISGFGLAIAITSPRLREALTPVFRGYANQPPSHDLRYSHANYPGLVTLEASLDYMERLSWHAIYLRNERLRRHLAARLTDLGADVVTPENAAAIVSIRLSEPQVMMERLAAEGVSVEARGRCLRISPHFYNNEADVDRFAEILAQLQKETD